MQKQWLLIVFDGRGHDRLLHRLGLKPSKSKATQYIGFYSLGARALLEQCILSLKDVGLRGIARKVEARAATKTPARRRRRLPAAGASAQIIQIETAKEERLAREALKFAREKRRQAEKQAERDAYAETCRKAESAVKRARGEQ